MIAAMRPTHMQATPATWRALIETGWTGAPGLTALCGGAALSRDLADALHDRVGGLWNLYGPTETTIWSLAARVERDGLPVPIGRPIANTTALVLDPGGNPLPVGVAGELFIGGLGLARGYRGRPDLTAARFAPSAALAGAVLYRTGDLARLREDGAILFLGRIDHEEKIRGYRVAVEEVEDMLTRHDGVASAVVRGWPDISGDRALVAYVVARGAPAPSVATLRAHLARLLPDYMVPTRFEALARLPMTPNGKVDRNALPPPGDVVPRADPALPLDPAEQRLAAIWTEVLGVDAIGRRDSFFDLGGHSLLVVTLLQRVEKAYGPGFGMADFFQAYRLDEMARRLNAPGGARRARHVAI